MRVSVTCEPRTGARGDWMLMRWEASRAGRHGPYVFPLLIGAGVPGCEMAAAADAVALSALPDESVLDIMASWQKDVSPYAGRRVSDSASATGDQQTLF